MSTRGNKAQIAQTLGEETLIVWLALEQARMGLYRLIPITTNQETYAEMLTMLTMIQMHLDDLQSIELTLLYNTFLMSPGRE